MKAIIVSENGGPEVLTLQDVDDPKPGDHDLLVDVAASGINFMDIYGREGRPPYSRPTPHGLGAEGAGVVRAVGTAVTDINAGDHVAWTGVQGSYAEQVVLPADRAVRVPPDVSLETAAALMLQGCTAHYLATASFPISVGDIAVVHAAAGGVGLLLTQIVKQLGGVVVATTSGGADGEKATLAREAGADHIAPYDNFVSIAREASNGPGAHVVYDGVGASTFDASLEALRRRGTMVLYGGASGQVPAFELQRLAAGGSLFITRPTLADFIVTKDELRSRTDQLFGWVAAGELSVRIGGRYPLADAGRAHGDLAGRKTTGKLLLIP